MRLYQAIECKYLGPTTKGSRIKVICSAHTQFVSWKHELNQDENYYEAAMIVMRSLGWDKHSDLIGGVTKSGVYVFVQVPKGSKSDE